MITAESVTMTPRIFLSFAMGDKPLALRVKSLLLQQRELRIFSPDDLSAGENFAEKLKAEIADCDLFITFLTPTSVNSSWVLSELGAAWGLGKPILPIVSQSEILNRLPASLFNIRGIVALTVPELEQAGAGERILSILSRKAL